MVNSIAWSTLSSVKFVIKYAAAASREVFPHWPSIIGCGNPSTVLFKAKLQFTKKIDRIIPYPDPKPETTIWEGCLSLVGGSVQGFLSRTNGSHYPNCYNLNAVYTKLKEGDTIVINVSNIKLSI